MHMRPQQGEPGILSTSSHVFPILDEFNIWQRGMTGRCAREVRLPLCPSCLGNNNPTLVIEAYHGHLIFFFLIIFFILVLGFDPHLLYPSSPWRLVGHLLFFNTSSGAFSGHHHLVFVFGVFFFFFFVSALIGGKQHWRRPARATREHKIFGFFFPLRDGTRLGKVMHHHIVLAYGASIPDHFFWRRYPLPIIHDTPPRIPRAISIA